MSLTFMNNLDERPWPYYTFAFLSHRCVPAGKIVSIFLHRLAKEAMAILQCKAILSGLYIYGYIMFSAISQKRIFG